MGVNPISPDVFQGGQMTDLPVFSGTLDGTELLEIVAAPTGFTNEAAGVNYQITTLLLSQLISFLTFRTIVLTNGQYTNPAAPYVPPSGMSRVYVNKSVAENTYIQFAAANSYIVEPLVQDVSGGATALNPITCTFTGGETASGQSTVPISSAYGGFFFRPIPTLSKWTLGSA